MVNAVGVEKLPRAPQTLLPPSVTILPHVFPVISWEAPVLTFAGEIIGRRSRTTVKVKQLAINGGRHAVSAYPDGDVALQNHATLSRRVVRCHHLPVKQELREVKKRQVVSPCKSNRLRLLTAIAGVGDEPFLVGVEKRMKRACLHDFLPEGQIKR